MRSCLAPLLAAVLLVVASTGAAPEPAGVDPSIGKVEVTLDLPKDKPYVGEMIMLRMRSFIRADIVLDEIIQPPLTNFNWQQLGRDKPIDAMVDGFRVAGIERDLAIFPQKPGRLIIDPFVRRVTIVTDDNRRVQADFASKPVYIDVQNYSAIVRADAWWLPAKSLTITDNWSVQPDEIAPGTLARRTIVVEAVGVTGDRLPPPPEMRAPGTIAFRGPVNRETIVTEDGPIGRGTYQWDLRPVSRSPAMLPAINIPWFDTTERRNRDAAIPGIWVAYAGTLVHPSHEKPKTLSYWSAGPLVAALVGFAWTLALAFVLTTSRHRRGRRDRARSRALDALQRAARFQDADRFEDALRRLMRLDPQVQSSLARAAAAGPGLAAFDKARFGRDGTSLPRLKPLAAAIRRNYRDRRAATAKPDPALLALDGRMPSPGAPAPWTFPRRS